MFTVMLIGLVTCGLPAKLIVEGAAAADLAGWSIAASGSRLLVGVREDDDAGESSGSVRVYERQGTTCPGTWRETHSLAADDAGPLDRFGTAVAIDGRVAVIGARTDGAAAPQGGSAYVFRLEAGLWQQEAMLTAPDAEPDDLFGWAVAVDDDTCIIGAPFREPHGIAWVFRRTGGGDSWVPWTRLAPIEPTARHFGLAVAVAGGTLLVGDESDAGPVIGSGAVTVYRRSGHTWAFEARWTAEPESAFGRSLTMTSDTVLIGAPHDSREGRWAGAAWLYERDPVTKRWQAPRRLIAPDATAWHEFGHAVALHGDTALVGAPGSDDQGPGSGAVYTCRREATGWQTMTKLTAPDAEEDDRFGWSVAAAREMVAGGAPHESAGGFWAGAVYVWEEKAIGD